MSVHRLELPRHDHPFVGVWHIYAMEMWDASYFNMERQAFIQIRAENLGDFQFGLVAAGLHGRIEGTPPRQRFVFTWEGIDEMNAVTGSGRLRLTDGGELRGSIQFHLGDRSRFRARRAG